MNLNFSNGTYPYHGCFVRHDREFYVSCGANRREAMKMEMYPLEVYVQAVIRAKDCYKLLQKVNLCQENWIYVALSRVTTRDGCYSLPLLQADDPRIVKLGTLLLHYFIACKADEGFMRAPP
jgi:hypothetical protein